MTYEQGLRLTTRAIAVYFLFWVVTDLIQIPHEIVTIRHEMQETAIPKASASDYFYYDYLLRSAVLSLAENLLKIGLWLLAALSFYHCSGRVQRFFGGAEEPAARSAAD